MNKGVFKGQVKSGLLVFYNADRLREFLSSFSGPVEIWISKVHSIRSGQQNRAYFGLVVEALSEHTGYDKEDMHKLLSAMFLGTIDLEMGGKTYTIPRSTKNLTTVEFNKYVEDIQRWAAEFCGIVLPDPV